MARRRHPLVPGVALLTATWLTAMTAAHLSAAGGADTAAGELRAPAVRSQQYPEGTSSPARDGVFRFGANGVPGVVRFVYSFYGDFRSEAVRAVGGAARIRFCPGSSGPVTLFVHSVDRSGRVSAGREYALEVGGHADELGAP